jgi:GT2 family glycosyltransferase/lipopolysaccharide/colanic/teichoic acid biosynthesis glycosyltransferase
MTLSVIIVNYNVRQFLDNALSSVHRALQGIDAEVFVVDNGSDDGSAEMVAAKYPRVTLMTSKENTGFARANNTAIRRSGGRYILLLNPDTIVQEDTFKVMLEFFETHPGAGLAGCKILNPDGSFQLPCRRSFPTPWVAFTKTFGLSALFPRSRWFGRYNLTYLSQDETYQVEAVSGSFMMFRREVVEKIGGLDETFFMYGEDLDYCYRVLSAGYTIWYVHSTAIIHYKGESTRRSSINELRLFYHAMELFVAKHYNRSFVLTAVLRAGITLRGSLAWAGRAGIPLMFMATDALLVVAGLLLGEYLYFGHLFRFPAYAYPVTWLASSAIVVFAMSLGGLYTHRRYAILRATWSVFAAYVVISALVFFAKDYAFSRAVVVISGGLCAVFLPGWRLLLRRLTRSSGQHGDRFTLFGRRTAIVGTGPSAQEVLRKLRARVSGGYDVVGFIDRGSARIGERLQGVEIVGSLETISKVIDERRVGEVIFSTDGLSYSDILSCITRTEHRNVNFRLVPDSLEAIVGKTSIDPLDALPLVDIEYNIHKPSHKFAKRVFDVAVSTVLLLVVYPLVRLWTAAKGSGKAGRLSRGILAMPRVFTGEVSLVGLPVGSAAESKAVRSPGDPGEVYLGPEGLTGLVQLNQREDLGPEERERYELYYARNHSLLLDLEILVKSLLADRTN